VEGPVDLLETNDPQDATVPTLMGDWNSVQNLSELCELPSECISGVVSKDKQYSNTLIRNSRMGRWFGMKKDVGTEGQRWKRGILFKRSQPNQLVKNYMVMNVYQKSGSKWIFTLEYKVGVTDNYRFHAEEVSVGAEGGVEQARSKLVLNILGKDTECLGLKFPH
jgi:hypothetical protein